MRPIAVLGLALLTVLVCSLAELKRLREIHHGYIGILLWGFGLALGWRATALVGLLILADDTWQHWVQLMRPEYRSPLNRLYGLLWSRWPWLRAVNGWLDRPL